MKIMGKKVSPIRIILITGVWRSFREKMIHKQIPSSSALCPWNVLFRTHVRNYTREGLIPIRGSNVIPINIYCRDPPPVPPYECLIHIRYIVVVCWVYLLLVSPSVSLATLRMLVVSSPVALHRLRQGGRKAGRPAGRRVGDLKGKGKSLPGIEHRKTISYASWSLLTNLLYA